MLSRGAEGAGGGAAPRDGAPLAPLRQWSVPGSSNLEGLEPCGVMARGAKQCNILNMLKGLANSIIY